MADTPRLVLAKTIAADLRQGEGANLVAVGVYGSVARGEERRHSDVDMLVIVRRKRQGIRHAMTSGTLVTILQQTPAEARAEVIGPYPGMNDALGGWRSMRALYDPTGLLTKLRARSHQPAVRSFREAARRHFVETYEDLGKLWDAIEARDADEAREMAIWFSGGAMGTLFDLEAHVLKTGRRSFIEIRRYGRLGEAVRGLRYNDLSFRKALRLSEYVWGELLDRAAAKGVRLPRFPRDARGTL